MESRHQRNARMALEFLSRCRLEGREVPAFNEIAAWLGEMLDPPEKGPMTETLEELAERAMNPEPHGKGE